VAGAQLGDGGVGPRGRQRWAWGRRRWARGRQRGGRPARRRRRWASGTAALGSGDSVTGAQLGDGDGDGGAWARRRRGERSQLGDGDGDDDAVSAWRRVGLRERVRVPAGTTEPFILYTHHKRIFRKSACDVIYHKQFF
jgi:hypothetical protein